MKLRSHTAREQQAQGQRAAAQTGAAHPAKLLRRAKKASTLSPKEQSKQPKKSPAKSASASGSLQVPSSPSCFSTRKETFTSLSEDCIAKEVAAYFPDMNAFRQLCLYGDLITSSTYFRRESGDTNLDRGSNGCHGGERGGGRTPRKSSRQIKLLATLATELETMTRRNAAYMRMQADRDKRAAEKQKKNGSNKENFDDEVDNDEEEELDASQDKGKEAINGPFEVTCKNCRSRLRFHKNAEVLRGCVVAWVESTVTATVTSKTEEEEEEEERHKLPSGGEVSIPMPNGDDPEKIARFFRIRGILERASAQVAPLLALSRRAQFIESTSPSKFARPLAASPFPLNIHRSGCAVEDTDSKHNRTTSEQLVKNRKRAVSREVSLTFHSLHLINKDVLKNRRGTSFVLQTITCPGRPLALECYPKHMIHFAFLLHALLHTTTEELAQVVTPHAQALLLNSVDSSSCGSGSGGGGGGGDKTLKREVEGKDGKSLPLDKLYPCKSSDAVLVLGLGGNAIASCLDAVLPPAVPIDVVEIEPAVVEACVHSGQLPPSMASSYFRECRRVASSSDDGSAERLSSSSGDSPTCSPTAAAGTEFSDKASVLFKVADGHGTCARGSRYRVIVGDAYDFLRCGVPLDGTEAEPVVRADAESSGRGAGKVQYKLIFLDCYDPDRETMLLNENGLLALCQQRLQPGGVLLVNAHIVPRAAVLETHGFLGGLGREAGGARSRKSKASGRKRTRGEREAASEGANEQEEPSLSPSPASPPSRFQSVQVLRVAGCDQSIVACLMPLPVTGGPAADTEDEGSEGVSLPFDASHYTLTNARRMATFLNHFVFSGINSAAASCGGDFQIDGEWIKSSKVTENRPGMPLRVWEHYS